MPRWCLLVLPLLPAPLGTAAESPPPVGFVKEVQPLLQSRCVSCHGPEKQRGGLRLDSGAAVLRGGDSGPAVPLLLQRITSTDRNERMPPSGEPLTPMQIALVKAWIDQGAKVPASTTTGESHWAFQPRKRPAIPQTQRNGWARNPIDAFILARLEKEGLAPSPEAAPATLARRLAFDLIGLPTVEDGRIPHEAQVERLLSAPQFGERWARHWLDVVRFAESHGFEMNQMRPNAWRYRDWVIRAFNSNLPFDRFVQAQIAGDAVGEDLGTGFLVGGPWDQVKSPDATLTANQRADELHDMVSTTSSAFLGLTLGCARCHGHKFDPIPQTDYYAVRAVFEGVQHGERELRATGSLAGRPPVRTGENVDTFAPTRARFLRFTIRATSGAEPCLDELEVFTPSPERINVARTAKPTASGTYTGNPAHKLEHINDGQYGNSRSWISNEAGKGWVQLEFAEEVTIDRVVWSRDRTQPPRYQDRLATGYTIALSPDGKNWTTVSTGDDRKGSTGIRGYLGTFTQPGPTKRLHRGDPLQPREAVPPGALSQIGPRLELPPGTPEQQRRLALARWITSPDNPLTARVIVNRLWQFHFGTGLVETPSDFGKNGGRPSHPELLDWLANELIDHDWDLKHIHRLIVNSATYRQSSLPREEALRVDASNRLLWRYSPRRLEAESLRDVILATSGQLNLRMTGPGFDLFEPNSNYVKVYKPKENFGPEDLRRMIYWSKPRMQLDDTFGAFDCPDAGQIAPRRNVSTTPLQALNLLNSPFLIQQAEAFAERIRREAGDGEAPQIERAFRLAFQRLPKASEKAGARKLLAEHGLSSLCRALLNANEFLYVD